MKFSAGDEARQAVALIQDALEDLDAALADTKSPEEASVVRTYCAAAVRSALLVLDMALTEAVAARKIGDDINKVARLVSGSSGWEVFPLSDSVSSISLNRAGRIRAMTGSEVSIKTAIKRMTKDVYMD
jgi:hypothetical protein